MKALITLMILSLAPAAFAGGSWKLNCTSDAGISFSSDNGLSEIVTSSGTADVSIENYDLGLDTESAEVKWIGSQKILSESYENSCNSDISNTVFNQKVLIIIPGSTAVEAEAICREDISTNAGAESDECLN